MCRQDHITGTVCDAVIWVRGHIIQELRDCRHGVLGGLGLLGADSAESGKEFVVDGPCIVQEGANNTLNLFDAFVVEGRTGVDIREELFPSTIDDFAMCMWGMLRAAWFWMIVLDE